MFKVLKALLTVLIEKHGLFPQVQPEGGGSVSRLWAAAGLLPALQYVPPQAPPPPAALQTHPGEAVQALPTHPRWLQGLQRYSSLSLHPSLHPQCLCSCSDLSSLFQHPWLTSPRWCCSSKGPWWRWRTSRSFWSWRKIWLALITSPSLEGWEPSPWFQRCAKWVMVIFQHR